MWYISPFKFSRLLLLLAVAAGAGMAQEEGNRYALVIGNNAYTASPLQNAINDARAVEKALKDANFRTTLVENSSLVALNDSVGEFIGRLGPADTALFFYAGHGVQIENENFLVPTDFEAATNLVAAKFKLFSVAQLFENLKNRPKRSVVILDACRSNPIAKENALAAGLAQPQNAPNESYVVFSTGPGQTAADNPNGRNSYFTEALSIEIAKPGLTIEEVVNHVRASVASETAGKQTPWALSSLKNTFYFHPPLNLESEKTVSLAVKWMADAKRFEQREEWDEAIDRVDQVIQRKTGGNLQSLAEIRKAYLVARRDAQAAYDKGDFAAAAAAYETAFRLDPFAIGAAFEGVNSYLEVEQIDPAVRLLHAIRVRGTSDDNTRAMKMIAELKGVDKAASTEASAEVPAPPPIEEIFSTVRFGVPDWEGGKRLLAESPVDPSRELKELEAKVPSPAAQGDTATAQGATQPRSAADQAAINQILKAMFHVEVVQNQETRDLAIKRMAAGTASENMGTLVLEGADRDTKVVFQDQVLQLPVTLPVPAGKYEIRTVDKGEVVTTQEIEVPAGAVQRITVKK